MYKTIAILSLAAVGMVGCANNNKKVASIPTSETVTDISAPAPAFTAAPAPQPVAPMAAVPPVAQTASYEAAPVSGGSTGGSYTVKKGDTLYGIARAKYGDGKAWNKIVAANPGLSPSSLKTGTKITLP